MKGEISPAQWGRYGEGNVNRVMRNYTKKTISVKIKRKKMEESNV